MRLFIDCRYVRTQVHDGISRYTASLTAAAAQLTDVTMLIHDKAQLNLLPDLPRVQLTSPTSVAEPWVPRLLNSHAPEAVFSPMQTMGSIGRQYPLILTLHDMIYYQHRTPPRDLPAPIRWGWRAYHLSYAPQRYALNRADVVATVSETTRELMTQHQLTRRPIQLIANAPQQVEQPRDPHQPPTRELVYMGSFMEYKNVETLVRTVNRLPGYRLHLCSPITPARRAQLAALAQRPGQLVFHNGISDADYNALLRQCTALVTLSRAEGYGLPLIEAMSHGTPVICSDLPIFSEVTGLAPADHRSTGAQLIPPDDDAACAAAVGRLEGAAEFASHSRAARHRSEAYTWEESAARLLEACDTASSQFSR